MVRLLDDGLFFLCVEPLDSVELSVVDLSLELSLFGVSWERLVRDLPSISKRLEIVSKMSFLTLKSLLLSEDDRREEPVLMTRSRDSDLLLFRLFDSSLSLTLI